MKKLLIVVMACYGLNARSQTNDTKNSLYLYSDSVVHAEKIRLRPDFAGSWALRADSRRVPINQVKFFNNEDGFFANTKKLNLFGESAFAERIIEGKINLYQQVIYDDVPFRNDYYRFRARPRAVANTRMFFNKGFLDLKKVSYDNLNEAMADNPKSLDLLKAYRKSQNTGTIMYVAAGAALLGSMLSIISGDPFTSTSGHGGMPTYKDRNYTGSIVLLGAGLGLATGGYLIQESGKRNIERAIENYNR